MPFPYTDRALRQHRPALVVSQVTVSDAVSMLWVLMVTSAENRRWPGDVSLEANHVEMGLPAPSLVRTAKIMTIEARNAEWRGMIATERLTEVRAVLARHLGFSVS